MAGELLLGSKTKAGNYELKKTPTFNEIINAAYGVDRERYLELDNDSFRSDQYQQLVTALIDGEATTKYNC